MDGQDFTEHAFSAADGLKLYARVYGEDGHAALPAICLPGLTRNSRDFHELALALSSDPKSPRKVICFDFRGRGRSAHDPDWKNYNVITEANDVLAGLAALGVSHGIFIGTSRGGLVMHVLGGMRPGVMKAGILNDVGPVIEGDGLTQIRSYLERAPKPATWDDARKIQSAVLAEPFPALSEADIDRMTRAIYRDENGKPVPDYDPNLLKTLTSVDLSKPLPELWPQFVGLTAMPLMAIRGANSRLLSEQTVDKMRDFCPALEVITVAGQGHAPLLETGDLPRRIAVFAAKADKGH
ncbi:MAG: alpha/beta hydrolase [Notoacmeibacter sp.]|nr:alpha/beta hydrolase [Notoacmeibacter sp.]